MKKKKIIGLIALLFLFFFSFARPMYAVQEELGDEKVRFDLKGGWETVVKWGSALTGNVFEDIQKLLAKMPYTIAANLVTELAPELTTSYEDLQEADIPYVMKRGVVGVADDQLVAMFNSYPSVDVIAHLSNEWVPGYKETQSVYATGYEDLRESGIDSLWSKTRDLAYLGFVVIMIGIGFMIMFRSKIGGQALVTVGNSIPRIVIALVLVTFSFAIIGLIIDVSGTLMGFIGSIFGMENPVNPMNIFQIFKGLLGMQDSTNLEAIGAFVAIDLIGAVMASLGLFSSFLIPGVGVATFMVLLILLTVIAIVTFGVIKLWFVLVKAYLGLLVNVIIAPLSIMIGAFPGSQQATGNMFKSVLRNALVFPMAFAIINLPYAFEPGQLSLNFPATFNPDALLNLKLGGLILAIAKIVAIYIAAQSPIFLKSMIPASAPKSGVDAAGAIKQSLTKMPLLGGLFKEKR
jgi:hypothetical protein